MAHHAMDVTVQVIPMVGHPGVGYESLGKRLNVDFEAKDGVGSRQHPLLPSEWRYDISYIWEKALQFSEKGRQCIWSFGGENCVELLALRWPKAIYLMPPTFQEWVRRADAFRSSVGEPPLSPFDKESAKRSLQAELKIFKFYSTLWTPSRLLVLDSSKSLDDNAAVINKFCL